MAVVHLRFEVCQARPGSKDFNHPSMDPQYSFPLFPGRQPTPAFMTKDYLEA